MKRLTREKFDSLSHEIMGHIFACQNEIGKLCDESVYRNDIKLRLETAGLGPVEKQVSISITLHDFSKTYHPDLIVQNGFMAELKTVCLLTKEHDSQLLNYLLIADLPHGKLVNLRPYPVEYRTVNAVVSAEARRTFTMTIDRWKPETARCRLLGEVFKELLETWGAFLDRNLYEQALIHFLGGEQMVLRRVPLSRMGFELGSQEVTLVTDKICFRLTALSPEAFNHYESHLRRFLTLTPLSTLHWINLHHHDAQLVTLNRS